MNTGGIYFGTNEFYDLIRRIGGQWNDSKERPVVCLVQSVEYECLYWAIPIGKWQHRTKEARERIERFMNYDDSDIRSCFYHLGNTDERSIFFISDVVPITSKYIEREYLGKYTGKVYIIKNKRLLGELQRKLSRILAWERASNNYFRQHITDVERHLIGEARATDNTEVY